MTSEICVRARRLLLALTAALVLAAPAQAAPVLVQLTAVSVDGQPMPNTTMRVSFGGQVQALGSFTAEPGTVAQVQLSGQAVNSTSFEFEHWPDCRPLAQIPVTTVQVTVHPSGTFAQASPQNTHVIPMPAPVAAELTEPDVSEVERRFVALVNADRAALGRVPLAIDERLSVVADARSTDNSIHRRAGHLNWSQCAPWEVVAEELGVTFVRGAYQLALENTTSCAPGAETGFGAFKGSASHYRTLMGSEMTRIGVGYVDGAWTAIVNTGGYTVTGPVPARGRATPRSSSCLGGGGGDDGGDGASRLSIDRLSSVLAGRRATISGEADPGRQVRVSFDHGPQPRTVTADEDGLWRLRVTLERSTRVTATAGGATVTRTVRVRTNAGIRRARVRNGTLQLEGRLLPAGRAKLTVRVGAGRTTITRAVRSSRSGRWSLRVRLPHQLRGKRLTVQAKAPSRPGFASAGTASRRVRA